MVAWNVRGVGYGSTTFPHAARLARGPASPGVGVGPAGLDAARRRRGLGRDPRGGQPVAEAGPGGGPGGAAAPARPRRAPGAPPKLTAAQRARVPALLAWGPAAFGFRGDVWTAPRIAAVIETHFGVRYHPAHVSRLMRARGWSPQRPRQR